MVGGAVIVGICLLVLGWTAEIVGLFVDDPATVLLLFPRNSAHAVLLFACEPVNVPLLTERGQRKSATVVLAVLSIYAVDFAINAGR
jgi:solute carrier family 45 protein 1/2/4